MIPRFGDAYRQLPARCLLASPELSPREFEGWGGTQYEGLLGDLLGMGTRVPGYPGACTVPGCDHGKLYHRLRTRTAPCLVQDCGCTQYQYECAGRTGTI